MASDGVITQKDIIEDKALTIGKQYADNMVQAIEANKLLVLSLKEINKLALEFKGIKDTSGYITAKQQQALETQKVIDAIKRQEASLSSLQRIESASITITQKKLALANKEEAALAKKARSTAEEIYNQSVLARNAKNQAILTSKLSSEYEKLTVKQKIAATALQNIIILGRRADETQTQYNIRLRAAQNEFDALNRSVVQANRAIGRFNDNVGNYPSQAGAQIKDLMGAFGVVVGIDLFATSLQEAFDVIRNFEAEIVNLAAIAGFSREEIAPLEADIRAVAAASINSATDVAKLATELIKLGSTPEEVSKLLKPVNDLSIALQASAEDSATLVKSLLNAYQEGADKAIHFTDVLAESANRSALDFAGLRDAFSYVAPVANTLGISVERTAALIGTLADNGIKAESAGRLLSTGLGRLAGQGLTLEKALSKITDAQKEGKTSLEVLTVANNLFGNEAGKLALILANNTKKIDESTIAYENSNGALDELTNKQLKSINSELEILSSAWEEYILNTNDAAGGTRVMTNTLSFLSKNLSTIADVLFTAVTLWGVYKASLAVAQAQQYLLSLSTATNTVAVAQNTVAVVADTTATDANTAALLAQIAGLEGATVAQEVHAVATNASTTATQKLNAALKANALFIIIAALVTAVYLWQKYNKTVEEQYAETNKSTNAFLKNKEAVSKNSVSISDLSKRYDELKAKSKLTIEEQKELNEIMLVLSKTVPGATTQMDKYGNAIAINTTKTREYIKAQDDMIKLENQVKLKENIKLLEQLKSRQEGLNGGLGNKNSFIEGIGFLEKQNGLIKTRTNLGLSLRNLTLEELALYAKKRFENEQEIANTQALINKLKGLTEAQKASLKAKEDTLKGEDKGPRTIAIIDAEIKAQEDLILTLSDKSGKEGAIVKAKIKALNDERDLIYNNNKSSEKDYERLNKKQLDQMKRIRDAIYNLNQFRLQNAIDTNQLIVDDEKKAIDVRIDAYTENEQLRQSKNEETLQYELLNNAIEGKELEKLTKVKRDLFFKSTKDRIQAIESGSIAVSELSKGELLILEKYNAEKKKLELQSKKDKQSIIDSEVEIIKKRIEQESDLVNLRLNKEIEGENKIFKAVNDIESQSRSEREAAIFEHEKKIYEIRKKYAMDALQVQINALQAELDQNAKRPIEEQISADKRKKIETELQAAKTELSDIGYQNYLDKNDERIQNEAFTTEKILELSSSLADSLGSIADAIFQKKIQNIEVEIEKNNEYYDKQIELAGEDEKQKDLLEKERDKKNAELEKKKRKEQQKQAVYNKALAITQAAINTALAITAALTVAPPASFALAAVTAAIAAVQLAAVVATPIPKYKIGRKGGKKEKAIINDGVTGSGNYVPEVVESKDGTAKIYEGKNRLVQLMEGDTVHKSVEDYTDKERKKLLNGVQEEGRKLNEFQKMIIIKDKRDPELISEIKLLRKSVERNKPLKSEQKTVDLSHALWKLNQQL